MFSCNFEIQNLRNPQFYQIESGKLVLINMYPYEATYIPGKSKGRVLLDRNQFKYIHNKTNNLKTKAYYVCSYKRTHNCNVTATVDIINEPNQILDVRGDHSHDN